MKWKLKFEFDKHEWHITPLVGFYHEDDITRFTMGWLCIKLVLEGWDSNWIPF